MKQVNVRDETHQLCRQLSLKTGKSILNVIQGALILYQDKFEEKSAEDKLVDRLLREVSEHIHATVIDAVDGVVCKELPIAIEAAAKILYEAQAKIVAQEQRELTAAFTEATAEEEITERPELSTLEHDEFYSNSNSNGNGKPGV